MSTQQVLVNKAWGCFFDGMFKQGLHPGVRLAWEQQLQTYATEVSEEPVQADARSWLLAVIASVSATIHGAAALSDTIGSREIDHR